MGAKKKSINNTTTTKSKKATNNDQNDIDYKIYTKEQLKVELKKRGLKVSGNKTELLQRLGVISNMTNPAIGSGTTTTSRRKLEINGSSPKNKGKNENDQREKEREEREKLVLWRHPIKTIYYATLESIHLIKSSIHEMLQHRVLVSIGILLIIGITFLLKSKGPHQQIMEPMMRQVWWCLYWVGLGVLSSVGLGTGLHTFLLYLGPHIASVTLAAYECQSLNFPSPPYPDEIVCPDNVESTTIWQEHVPVWSAIFAIMAKVRLEAFMWGAGTALGELPPYFMARAARLSGIDPEDEDEDLREFEELQRKRINHEQMTFIEKWKLRIEQLVERVGFFGILVCASVPNPLFDLAGITCGHFLVPFWTFFGATLIGKAVIKMHIQKLFVIIAFNEPLLEKAVVMLGNVPYIGPKAQQPFKEFLNRQKIKLHRKSDVPVGHPQESSLLASLFEKFVVAMILYFVYSIINSFAQSYHKRIHKKSKKIATD